MKTNVYTQNLDWLKKRVSRFPYLVKQNEIPEKLEPDEVPGSCSVPFYNYTIFGFSSEVYRVMFLRDMAPHGNCEPFDLATLTKPKA